MLLPTYRRIIMARAIERTYVDKNGKIRKCWKPNVEEKAGVDLAIEFFTQHLPDCEFLINEAEKNGNYKYVWDIMVKSAKRKTFKVEVNVKNEWMPPLPGSKDNWVVNKKEEYPFCWPTMDYCGRKNDDGGRRELPTHHMTIGGDYERIFWNPRVNLHEEDVGPKWTTTTKAFEDYYKCPLPAPCSIWYEKNKNGDWKRVMEYDNKAVKVG